MFDWDEINFAEASREMIITGDYLTVRINYEPFHEKQPLFFWLQVISMKIFGINEFAARFPNVIIGILTLVAIFFIGKDLYDSKFGFLWVLSYIGSFLPNFYFRTGLIDPTFNLFIFLGAYFIFKFINNFELNSSKRYTDIIIAALFVSLATMTKGPVGYLIPALVWLIYWIIRRKKIKLSLKEFLLFTVISFSLFIIWYGTILIKNGWDIFFQNIEYQIRLLTTNDAGFSGPIYYHFLVVLIGCFPASIFALTSLKKSFIDNAIQNNYRIWTIVLLATVLVLFSLVQTKIIHYSSLTYLPITFLSAHFIYYTINEASKFRLWLMLAFVIIGSLWAILMIAIPIIGYNAEQIALQSSDSFTQEVLRSNVNWGGYEYILGLFYLILLIIATYYFWKMKIKIGFIIVTISTALVLFFYLVFVAPKIEEYVQGAPIEFLKTLKGKKCYIELLDVPNLKYSHYFYAEKAPDIANKVKTQKLNESYTLWLLSGDIDLPSYFITKITEVNKYMSKYHDLIVLYTKNGYAFLMRKSR